MRSVWQKLFPRRRNVVLLHNGARVGIVHKALCEKQTIDVYLFLTSNIKEDFYPELSMKILTLLCCSLQESKTSHEGMDGKEIIALHRQVLQKSVTTFDLALVGRILDGCSLVTERGKYLRLVSKIDLPYSISWSEINEETIN
jgi:hypothetical protein